MAGIAAAVLVVASIDIEMGSGAPMHDPGAVYLLLAILVTYWSGLRAGIIVSAMIVSYLAAASYIPGSAYGHVPWDQRHALGFLVLLPPVVVVLGLVQGRIRNADIKSYDAAIEAKNELLRRHSSEAALKSQEDLWGVVVDASMDAIIVVDDHETITLWSSAAEVIFGWTQDEAKGRSLGETILPDNLRTAKGEAICSFFAEGEGAVPGRRLEMAGVSKDGRVFPVEITIVYHRTGAGLLYIAFVRDVSEIKKLADRLRQAQRMEAIGTLAGGVAHEFNNVIAAISGNVAIVRDDLPQEHDAQVSLAEVEKATERAAAVVRQILTFSRNEEQNSAAVDVPATIQEALQLLRATIPASVEIESRFEPTLPPIWADAGELHQIIVNLAINASQAMRHGGRLMIEAIRMKIDEVTASELLGVIPGQYVRISVSDTGVGMDSTTLQRIFEPFFTTKAVGEGTGLGLSVVYGIVERNKGAITVYSEPNKGTVFHIYFPVAPESIEVGEAPAAASMSGNRERIIYLDDDEALVFMMTRMLRRLNYEVVGFQYPREALDAIRTNPDGFDVLVTDLSMPQMAGPDLAREVRNICRDLPIVMVTGYIRPEDSEMAHAIGVEHLVLKPNSVREMSQILHRILTERPRNQDLHARPLGDISASPAQPPTSAAQGHRTDALR